MAKRLGHLDSAQAGQAIIGHLSDEADALEARAAERRHAPPAELIRWAEETLRIETKDRGWTPLVYRDWQREAIRELFSTTDEGLLEHSTGVVSWPRRHGKSTVTTYYDIFRCKHYQDQLVIIQANSQDQALSTAWTLAAETIEHSPELMAGLACGEIAIQGASIYFRRTGSEIRGVTASKASAYGKGISVFHATELCVAPDDDLWNVGASSTGDSWCGIALCDSNVGDDENIVWRLIEAGRSGADPETAVSYVSYESIADHVAKGYAPWLAEGWLRSRRLQMRPAEFKRNHLNVVASGGENIFEAAEIEALTRPRRPVLSGGELPMPAVFNREAFAAWRRRWQAVWIGVGLDRAMSFSKNADRSIFTAIAKGFLTPEALAGYVAEYRERADSAELADLLAADPYEYLVLECVELPHGLPAFFEAGMRRTEDRFGRISNACLEAYQANDLYIWCEDNGYRAELSHASSQTQANMFNTLAMAIRAGRVAVGEGNWLLALELARFEERTVSGRPSFAGKKGEARRPDTGERVRVKDDSVYSLGWGVWSLREFTSGGMSETFAAKPEGY